VHSPSPLSPFPRRSALVCSNSWYLMIPRCLSWVSPGTVDGLAGVGQVTCGGALCSAAWMTWSQVLLGLFGGRTDTLLGPYRVYHGIPIHHVLLSHSAWLCVEFGVLGCLPGNGKHWIWPPLGGMSIALQRSQNEGGW